MARPQNYGFDKRRKEQERKAKKDAKAAERRQRRDERSAQESADNPAPSDVSNVVPNPPGDQG